MHKTNSSKFGHGTFEDRPLDNAELNAVTGGLPEFERGVSGPPSVRSVYSNVTSS